MLFGLAILASLALAVAPVGAVTDGEPDGRSTPSSA